jgi:hypothetical protein
MWLYPTLSLFAVLCVCSIAQNVTADGSPPQTVTMADIMQGQPERPVTPPAPAPSAPASPSSKSDGANIAAIVAPVVVGAAVLAAGAFIGLKMAHMRRAGWVAAAPGGGPQPVRRVSAPEMLGEPHAVLPCVASIH